MTPIIPMTSTMMKIPNRNIFNGVNTTSLICFKSYLSNSTEKKNDAPAMPSPMTNESLLNLSDFSTNPKTSDPTATFPSSASMCANRSRCFGLSIVTSMSYPQFFTLCPCVTAQHICEGIQGRCCKDTQHQYCRTDLLSGHCHADDHRGSDDVRHM